MMCTRCLKRVEVLVFMLACFSVLLVAGATRAQDRSDRFQESEESFFEVLQEKPKAALKTKGLVAKGLTKGPEGIVDDYAKLAENPTARALILFDFDSDVIKSESYGVLRNLGKVLSEQLPEIRLIVAGHTDSTGGAEYNEKLSQRRARSVKMFLEESYGIQPERLLVQGYGEEQPLTDNATEQQRAQNRRVEFIRVE